MRRVLLITNSFPPMLGGGVLRPSRLAKYLPDWGWEPVVLTMTVPLDAGRLGDPAKLYARQVIRSPRLDPTEWFVKTKAWLTSWRRPRTSPPAGAPPATAATANRPRLSNAVLVPDPRVGWIPLATLAGLRAVRRQRAAAIFTMSPDASAHLVGLLLKRLTGRRWVAEFRDPWMTNPFRHPRPYKWMERLEQRLEEAVVFGCDHLCVTSREYRDDFLRRYPGLSAAKVSYIPNGFDPADFECLEPERFARFTLLHAGNFYGARSAGFFLTAYGRVLDRRPDLRVRTQVAFVGSLDKAATDMLGGSSMRANVLLLGHRPHRTTLGLTCGANALLLIPGPGKGTMPGKTYEYLRAGRPIYCIASEGPAAALIRETGAGLVEPSEDPGAIADSLEQFLDRVQMGGDFVCAPEALRQFDRREIAGQIARVLEASAHA